MLHKDTYHNITETWEFQLERMQQRQKANCQCGAPDKKDCGLKCRERQREPIHA